MVDKDRKEAGLDKAVNAPKKVTPKRSIPPFQGLNKTTNAKKTSAEKSAKTINKSAGEEYASYRGFFFEEKETPKKTPLKAKREKTVAFDTNPSPILRGNNEQPRPKSKAVKEPKTQSTINSTAAGASTSETYRRAREYLLSKSKTGEKTETTKQLSKTSSLRDESTSRQLRTTVEANKTKQAQPQAKTKSAGIPRAEESPLPEKKRVVKKVAEPSKTPLTPRKTTETQKLPRKAVTAQPKQSTAESSSKPQALPKRPVEEPKRKLTTEEATKVKPLPKRPVAEPVRTKEVPSVPKKTTVETSLKSPVEEPKRKLAAEEATKVKALPKRPIAEPVEAKEVSKPVGEVKRPTVQTSPKTQVLPKRPVEEPKRPVSEPLETKEVPSKTEELKRPVAEPVVTKEVLSKTEEPKKSVAEPVETQEIPNKTTQEQNRPVISEEPVKRQEAPTQEIVAEETITEQTEPEKPKKKEGFFSRLFKRITEKKEKPEPVVEQAKPEEEPDIIIERGEESFYTDQFSTQDVSIRAAQGKAPEEPEKPFPEIEKRAPKRLTVQDFSELFTIRAARDYYQNQPFGLSIDSLKEEKDLFAKRPEEPKKSRIAVGKRRKELVLQSQRQTSFKQEVEEAIEQADLKEAEREIEQDINFTTRAKEGLTPENDIVRPKRRKGIKRQLRRARGVQQSKKIAQATSNLSGIITEEEARIFSNLDENVIRGGITLFNNLAKQMQQSGNLRVETIMTVLGSLAGYATQAAAREKMVNRLKLSDDQVFSIVETVDGSKYYFGDAIDRFLQRDEHSIWYMTATATMKLTERIDCNIDEIVRYTIRMLGKESFGIPRLSKSTAAAKLPLYYVEHMWASLLPGLERFSKDPVEWPQIFGVALQRALISTKDILDPNISLKIILECAVPMSVVDANIIEVDQQNEVSDDDIQTLRSEIEVLRATLATNVPADQRMVLIDQLSEKTDQLYEYVNQKTK